MDENPATKLCVEILMRGCVTSFVDLYKLSHREPVCIDQLAGELFSIPKEKLPWIAEVLAEAEESKRKSKFSEVYEKYVELADYFESCGDTATAINFHNTALKCVKLSSDKELEGTAYEVLGLAYERIGELKEAVRCHETFLRIAEASRTVGLKSKANTNLVRVYIANAEKLEKEGLFEEAKDFYDKAVHTANNNGDQEAEAEAYSKLGGITVLLGDLNKALEYQKRFLLVSKQLNSERREGKAVRECAALQEKLKQHEEAVQSLKRALEIAEEHDDIPGIADSCQQLGHLYTALSEHTKAVHYYKESYKVYQVLGDQHQIQQSRIKVGVAEGNLQWTKAGDTGYTGLVSTNIQLILAWKGKGQLA
eukprot:TRINITY_DN14345_c2_g1_i1.p1 TRINITY_DN14345_c2_g1~~TRINITY_DN14345_c2_g1_i1.p1  ORF type:complete len:366 (+),score=71.05 TRINITY_DN14345_c2_g1_i1:48-1145(+)